MSPGRCALPLGMFSTKPQTPMALTLAFRAASKCISPKTTPAPVPPPEGVDREATTALGGFGAPAAEAAADGGAAATASWWTRLDPRKNDTTRVIGSLAVVIGLLLLMRTFIRRAGGGGGARGDRPSGVLEVLARYPVGRGQSLVLLKLARRLVLVHHAGTAMTTICEVQDRDEVAALLSRLEAGSRGSAAQRFKSLLQRFESEHEPRSAAPARPARSTPARSFPLGGEPEVVDLTRARGSRLRRAGA